MPVTVIVGGQYGSEGKGKVAHWLAQERAATTVVRTGGPNAGHTVVDETNAPLVLRQLPTSAILPDVTCVLAAGSYIDVDVLFNEIRRTGLEKDRLVIDPNAAIISEEDKQAERDSTLRASIGSTQSGTGASVVRRVQRQKGNLATHDARLADYVRPVSSLLRTQLQADQRIIIEGTQGFGLSLLHSPSYPYVTSRDTTAASFISEVGLSPLDVDEVVMVLRAFPIRVSGNSGPLPSEIDWDTLTAESGSPTRIVELTSVTHRVRRIARFDPGIVRKAISVNAPTQIVMNHLDYVDYECRGANAVTPKARRFVDTIERFIDVPIDYVGLSPQSLIGCHTAQRAFAVVT